MESRAISPSKTALPHAYAPLAPFEAVKERRSGVGVRWRACISVLTAVAVVVPVVASMLSGSSSGAAAPQYGGLQRG